MLFNSIEFLVFFVGVLITYYLLPHRFRWMLLLGASYYFYMAWNPWYISLIIISTVIDFLCSRQMAVQPEKVRRKPFLYLSLLANLSILMTFKYFNFFSGALTDTVQLFDPAYGGISHNLLLPMGISFYTFQTMSYSIDVYQGKVKAEQNLGIFALFVSFFPQLVAGPIERAGNLLTQFRREVTFDYTRFTSGLKLVAWGMFKKVVIADRLAILVNEVYNQPSEYTGVSLAIATFFFAFQIYCDFSGYSDIAIGTARMMGFDLMENFHRPYFSKSIGEFWRRWHISLSTWFRDYLYIPLGGNRVVKWRWHYNLFITFLVSGLWHGANWTFVIWGALHGGYIVLENVARFPIRSEGVGKYLRMAWTFLWVCVAWVFFRANSLEDAVYICNHLITDFIPSLSMAIQDPLHYVYLGQDSGTFLVALAAIGFMEIIHILQRYHGTQYFFEDKPAPFRWSFYTLIMLGIVLLGVYHSKSEFIYFQF